MKESRVAGRIAVYIPSHPQANNRGYILRARYIIEQYLGRYLTSNENVHHKNGDPLDDRLENLEVLDRAKHTSIHSKDRKFNKGENHYLAKLTSRKASSIRKLYLNGWSQRQLARHFHVGRGTIRKVLANKTWKVS